MERFSNLHECTFKEDKLKNKAKEVNSHLLDICSTNDVPLITQKQN